MTLLALFCVLCAWALFADDNLWPGVAMSALAALCMGASYWLH